MAGPRYSDDAGPGGRGRGQAGALGRRGRASRARRCGRGRPSGRARGWSVRGRGGDESRLRCCRCRVTGAADSRADRRADGRAGRRADGRAGWRLSATYRQRGSRASGTWRMILRILQTSRHVLSLELGRLQNRFVGRRGDWFRPGAGLRRISGRPAGAPHGFRRAARARRARVLGLGRQASAAGVGSASQAASAPAHHGRRGRTGSVLAEPHRRGPAPAERVRGASASEAAACVPRPRDTARRGGRTAGVPGAAADRPGTRAPASVRAGRPAVGARRCAAPANRPPDLEPGSRIRCWTTRRPGRGHRRRPAGHEGPAGRRVLASSGSSGGPGSVGR